MFVDDLTAEFAHILQVLYSPFLLPQAEKWGNKQRAELSNPLLQALHSLLEHQKFNICLSAMHYIKTDFNFLYFRKPETIIQGF